MKVNHIGTLIVLFGFIASSMVVARLRISKQLEKAPLGDRYLVVTDSITGEQAYEEISTIVGGGGGGESINDLDFDGDTLSLETNLATYTTPISSTTINVDSSVTIPSVGGFVADSKLQTIIDAIAENLDHTVSGFEIIGDSLFEIRTFGLDTLRDTLRLPTAGVIYVYQSGNALIKATGTGVTYSFSGNMGTVTIPSGVRLEYVRVNQETGDLASGNDYTLRIVNNNADVNQGTVADFMPPICQFIKRDNLDNDPPTSTFPFIYTVDQAPSPQMQIVDYGSNSIDIKFKSVDNFSKWTVIATF